MTEWLIILCWMISYWTYMNMYLGVELIYCLSIRLFLSDRLNFIFHFWAGLGNWEGQSLTRKKYLQCTPLSIQRKMCITISLTYIHQTTTSHNKVVCTSKYQSQTGIQWHCEFSLKFDSVYLISSSHISIPKTNEMWRVVREIYSKTFGSTEWICVYL